MCHFCNHLLLILFFVVKEGKMILYILEVMHILGPSTKSDLCFAGRRLTAVAQKAKDLPPQSRGLDGVETSDENVPPSKPLSDKANAGKVFINVLPNALHSL